MSAFIATVSAISEKDAYGNPAAARVLPKTANGSVTIPFAVYWPMRAGAGAVKVGDEVICLQFEDGSGLILSRPDGTFTQEIAGAITATDFNAGGKSLIGHTHQGAHGTTSPPI